MQGTFSPGTVSPGTPCMIANIHITNPPSNLSIFKIWIIIFTVCATQKYLFLNLISN